MGDDQPKNTLLEPERFELEVTLQKVDEVIKRCRVIVKDSCKREGITDSWRGMTSLRTCVMPFCRGLARNPLWTSTAASQLTLSRNLVFSKRNWRKSIALLTPKRIRRPEIRLPKKCSRFRRILRKRT